jgi:hypothetical protein
VTQCETNIPRSCSDAFGEIRESLARIEGKVEATHEQARRTNGHVAELFTKCAAAELHMARLDGDVVRIDGDIESIEAAQDRDNERWAEILGYGWKVSLALAGVVASLAGVKHLFKL